MLIEVARLLRDTLTRSIRPQQGIRRVRREEASEMVTEASPIRYGSTRKAGSSKGKNKRIVHNAAGDTHLLEKDHAWSTVDGLKPILHQESRGVCRSSG